MERGVEGACRVELIRTYNGSAMSAETASKARQLFKPDMIHGCWGFRYDGRLVENTCGGELVRHGTGLMDYGAVRQELAV